MPCVPPSLNSVCSSTQDDTRRAAWQPPTAAASSAGGVASLLPYPPYIGPVPPPPGVQPPAPPSAPVGVPPPRGVPIPTGVPPPAAGLPASVRVSLPTGVPLRLGGPPPPGVPPPLGISMPVGGSLPVGGPQPAGIPLSVGISKPVGVPAPLGGPQPSGIPQPVGISTPVPALLGGPLPVGVGGPQCSAIPPPAGISNPVGVSAPLGGPQPSGIPPPVGISTPVGVPALLGGPLPVGGPQCSAIPPPAGISNPVGVSAPLGGTPRIGALLPTVNSTLPPPRFMTSFDPSMPPPAFISAASSATVSSVTEMPVKQMSRVGEDMDLDNSESSDEDLGEGFDEEWPICSRRISNRSHDNSHYSTFLHDEGSQRSEYQNSGSNFHSSELHSMQDKQPVKSNEYFGIGVEQPHISQMYGTSLPAGGNNLAMSSAPVDHPHTMASMMAVGGPGLVRNVASLPQPASMPPAMPRAPGSVDQTSGSILRGLSDVDFRISSYSGGVVPAGPPPLSAPMKMAPPPLPPFAGPLPGTVGPFSSLPVPNNASAGISAGGFNNPVAGMDTPRDVLGPGMRGVGHAGSVGSRPPMLSGVGNMPGPMPAGGGTASAQGMVTGMARGPSDLLSVGPRFINTLPSSTFEPANLRPPGQQVFMQRIISPNPSTDVGLLQCQIQGGGQAVGRPVGPGSVELSSDMVAGNIRPASVGNVSLRGLTDFTGVDHTLIPPDSVRFNMQHEMLRVRAPASASQPPPMQNASQHPAGPPPQIPFPHSNLQGQFRAPSIEQKAPSSGPSERVLNALQSLAGMQTDSQDQPSLGCGGITDTRFADIQPADAGMRQMAPGLNKMSFGPQADISGFGLTPVRSLLQQQIRADGGGHSLLQGSLHAPPKITIGQPHLPLPGNVHKFCI